MEIKPQLFAMVIIGSLMLSIPFIGMYLLGKNAGEKSGRYKCTMEFMESFEVLAPAKTRDQI